MSAQGCPLPDHVTNPKTFKNDREACEAAKGLPNEREVCDYLSRAVINALGQSKPAARPTLRKRTL